jgi:fluoroacetyl-CoA thioesterase
MAKPTLVAGLRHEFRYQVPPTRTVPNLYPEAPEFAAMPEVFATGFLVGLLEWTCIQLLVPHLDWPAEQSVGTHICISHEAATPPGLTVVSTVELTAVQGRSLEFSVQAADEVDVIARGTHHRHLIDTARFTERSAQKSART